MIHLEIDLHLGGVEVSLNEIPVLRRARPVTGFVSMPVEQYVVDGHNVVRAAPYAPDAATTPVGRARVVRYPVGADVGGDEGEVLAFSSWPQDPARTSPSALTQRFSLSLRPRWSWEDAPRQTLDASTRAAALDLVRATYGAFVRGDAAALAAGSEVALREFVRAYPDNTLAGSIDGLSRSLATWWPMPGWRVAPLAEVSFELCAAGRVIACLDAARQHPLRAGFDDRYIDFVYPLFLAQIDGRLRIVR